MKQITYYFDFLSPFSYFAWKQLDSFDQEKVQFDYRPVLLGAIFSYYETKAPAMIPPKRNYLFKQALRFAKLHNIPFKLPQPHPFNPLYALRVALREVAGDKQKEIIDLFWDAAWGEGFNLGDQAVVEAVLEKNGFDSSLLLEKAFEKDNKSQLKQNTKEAIESGVFGLPTFKVDDEIFWGNDSLSLLKLYLNGELFYDKDYFNEIIKRYDS